MTIKIKMRSNHKAMVKFDKPEDEQYFIWVILQHRDNNAPHPKISIKNNQGTELPPLQKKVQGVSPQSEVKLVPPTNITPIKIETKPHGNMSGAVIVNELA